MGKPVRYHVIFCESLRYDMFDLTKNILSYSFEFLKDFSHVQELFFSAVSRVISALITRYSRVISAVKRVISAFLSLKKCS